MATDAATVANLLDEAAAIVEAEWMRLQPDVDLWERELADLPVPWLGRTRVGTTTAGRWSSQPMPQDRRKWPARPWPATPV